MRGTTAVLIAGASINVAAAWQHIAAHRPRKLTRRNADLYGGQDTQRNEDIEALKRAFYGGGSEDTFRDAAASDARLVATANEFGLIKDVPLCRWSMHLLPHQQTILNVWQPQYTHMQGLRVRSRGDGVQLIRHRRDVFHAGSKNSYAARSPGSTPTCSSPAGATTSATLIMI